VESYPFHADLKSLISSQTGCHLCTLLVQTIPRDEFQDFASGARDFGAMQLKVWQPKWMRKTDTVVKRWKLGSVQRHCLIALLSPEFNKFQIIHKFLGVVRTHGKERNLNFDPKTFSNLIYGALLLWGVNLGKNTNSSNVLGPDPLALRRPHEARLCQYNGAEPIYQMARKWIQDCVSDHALCCIPTRHQALPARLIRVGSDDLSDPPKVVLTSMLDTTFEYITLSYCWGRDKPLLKATTKNLHLLMKRIEIIELPKTVADAIIVTRGLKYQYLWVDSFCILQDSEEDWKVESTKMGHIYNNSICTICATSAASANQGFLEVRNPLSNLPCCIEGTLDRGVWAVSKMDRWFCKESFYQGPVCVTDSVKYETTNMEKCELNSRAWVVQVRFHQPHCGSHTAY